MLNGGRFDPHLGQFEMASRAAIDCFEHHL
jgi:hypothetical protein